MDNPFIQVSGENLVLRGEKIILRGFGIGSWMNTEHFMTGMPGSDHQKKELFSEIYGMEQAKEFFDEFLSDFITEQDFIFLKSLGVNTIRLPFTYRYFEEDNHPGQYLEEGFKHLDRVVALCEKYEIYAILDLHAAPGGQNPDMHADSDLGVSHFWHDASLRDRAAGLWAFLAEHYRENRWVAAYDLINEPVFVPDPVVLNDFYERTIEAIRKVDEHHVLFLEGDNWAQDFSKLYDPQDRQVAYSFHFYPGYSLKKKYPERWDRKDIENGLMPLIKLRERFHRPLWCGETGTGYTREKIMYFRDLMKDTLDILEENDISWTIWTYKDAGAMGIVYPGRETPWMRFVREMNWEHRSEVQYAQSVFDFFEERGHFKMIPEKTRFKLQFRLRGIFHSLYLEQLLKPKLESVEWKEIRKLPDSFLWENCEFHQEIADLFMSYTKR